MNKFITSARDLVTTHEQTRAGFLSIALEKNAIGTPYIKNALAFKAMVSTIKTVDELIKMKEVRPFLVTASGLSEKSLNYLNEDDRTAAIVELVDKFLRPASDSFIDETIYRYLLIKGDSVGGSMRNRIGALGQEKFIRTLLACMNVRGIKYHWLSNIVNKKIWNESKETDIDIEKTLKALYWSINGNHRVLAFNLSIPLVKKNVDLCLFACNSSEYNCGKIVSSNDKILMLGELKGGIDPAGADEHWKTASTALDRIRNAFTTKYKVKTSFVGAAIENAMADEIFNELISGKLDYAANLNNNDQLTDYCNWLIDL